MEPPLLTAGEMEADSGLLLYEPFYGLGEKPFSLSTDPRFLYKSASHGPILRELLAGIRRREGLVVLTGEIGMGKTTLCRSVLAALDRKTFSAFVPDPFVGREDLLKILLVEFGVVPVDDLVRGRLRGASRAELGFQLYEFLRSLEPLDAFAVLLVDEAQNLSTALLEEVRILADLEGTRKLLQVVLIGQPELSSALQLPHMRQVKQRVTTHCELKPLDRVGLHEYVAHRLRVAGASTDRLRFTREALDLVFEASGGVPRVVNRLCDRTLQHGHHARASTIEGDLVRLAIADLQIAAPADVPAPSAAAGGAPALAQRGTAAPLPRARARAAGPFPGAPRPLRQFAAPGAGARPAVATAALLVLGVLSGLSLAVYWGWAGPLLTWRVELPGVRRPSMRIAAPLPAVLPPAIEAIGDAIAPPQVPGGTEDQPPDLDAGPARPVIAAQSVWVVQVGAFESDARAVSLVGRLAARGFMAFTGARAMRNGIPLRLVLVGPYVTRGEAAAARDALQAISGVGEPFLQVVPPAVAARRP